MEKIVTLTNPSTGEDKEIKIGFHWMIAIFGGLLFPWTKLGLKKEGIFFCVMIVGNIIAPFIFPAFEETSMKLANILAIVLIVSGFQVAKLAVKNYLATGWTFKNPEAEEVIALKTKWKLVG